MECQHNIPLSLSHPSALCCFHSISWSAGVCCVLTLVLLLQWEEHLLPISSPSLTPAVGVLHLAGCCFCRASPRASSCSEPSCATSAELEREGIWPHPPVSLPPFGDLRCLSVYQSVCKDQATHPLLGCFNSAGCPGWRDQIMGEAGAHM